MEYKEYLTPRELMKNINTTNEGYNFNNTGKHWYNNSVESKRFFENEVPEGWVRGRLENTWPNLKGSMHYTNGEICIKLFEGDEIPEGFYRGRLNLKRDALGRYTKKDSNPTL